MDVSKLMTMVAELQRKVFVPQTVLLVLHDSTVSGRAHSGYKEKVGGKYMLMMCFLGA